MCGLDVLEKKYHLFSGDSFYPHGGMDDYKASYETEGGAVKAGQELIRAGDDWFHVSEGMRLIVVGNSIMDKDWFECHYGDDGVRFVGSGGKMQLDED